LIGLKMGEDAFKPKSLDGDEDEREDCF
jgi:hypothetical protein